MRAALPDSIVVLGSGGARIVVARQARASGGLWFILSGTQFLVDPGPGALVRATESRHRLDPLRLDGIILSHRHLDHSGDVNAMVEAMTAGGTQPRGVLFAPGDALEGDDPVVLKYVRRYLSGLVTLKEGGRYRLGGVMVNCPLRHRHRGEVYGFRFEVEGLTVSYVADTAYFPELVNAYRADIVLFNVVRHKPSTLDHLHAPEVEELVRAMQPRLSVLTHFGMTMLRARPWVVAREMSRATGCRVIAAADGQRIDLARYRSGMDEQ